MAFIIAIKTKNILHNLHLCTLFGVSKLSGFSFFIVEEN